MAYVLPWCSQSSCRCSRLVLSLTPAAAFAVHGNLQIVTMEGELPRATLSGQIIGLLIE